MSHPLTAPDATSAGTTTDHHEQPNQKTIDRHRAIADWFEAHPHAHGILYDNRILDARPQDARDLARLAREIGGRWEKDEGDLYFSLVQNIGLGVTYQLYAQRTNVCERVVIGTKEREVVEPDPEQVAALPTVTRTETEEIVEWRCPPSLLAATGDGDRA